MKQNAIEQSRAELFARETLGKDPERIKFALRTSKVVIGIPKAVAKSRIGQVGLLTAVNILARLGSLAPNLYIDVPSNVVVLPGIPLLPAGQPLRESLLAFMNGLAAIQTSELTRDKTSCGQRYDYGLFFGRVTQKSSSAVTIGSEKWLATVNPSGKKERIDLKTKNPLGIILAATLGSIEIVKSLWLPIKDSTVEVEPLAQRTIMSAFDLSINPKAPKNPEFPDGRGLGHVCVLGLGAIGSGCNYVLGCLDKIEMSLDLVDMDIIERTNEERLFTSADPKHDIGTPKVFHAQQFIKSLHKNVQVFAYHMPFEHYVDRARDRLGYVWCCLDSEQSRRLLQTELSSVLINGGTNISRWMLSLHEFERSENACLVDLYPERYEIPIDAIQDLANVLDIDAERVRKIAQLGARFDEQMIHAAMQKQHNPIRKAMISKYVGLTFNEAIAHRCSQARPNSLLPAATISFVSVLPAIFMVADLIKRRLYGWQLPKGDPNVFQFDSFRAPNHGTICNILAAKDCLCQSKSYVKAFRKRQELRQLYLGYSFSQPPTQIETQFPPVEMPRLVPAGVGEEHNQERIQFRQNMDAFAEVEGVIFEPLPIRGILLWFAALAIYLTGIAASLLLVGLLAGHEDITSEIWQPWQLLKLACGVKVTWWSWSRFAAVFVLPIATYMLLMTLAIKIIKRARLLYNSGDFIKAVTNVNTRIAAKALKAFFAISGWPSVFIGASAFGIISLRGLAGIFKNASEAACCVVVPFFFFMLYLLVAGLAVAVRQTVSFTWKHCGKVFEVPIRRKRQYG